MCTRLMSYSKLSAEESMLLIEDTHEILLISLVSYCYYSCHRRRRCCCCHGFSLFFSSFNSTFFSLICIHLTICHTSLFSSSLAMTFIAQLFSFFCHSEAQKMRYKLLISFWMDLISATACLSSPICLTITIQLIPVHGKQQLLWTVVDNSYVNMCARIQFFKFFFTFFIIGPKKW